MTRAGAAAATFRRTHVWVTLSLAACALLLVTLSWRTNQPLAADPPLWAVALAFFVAMLFMAVIFILVAVIPPQLALGRERPAILAPRVWRFALSWTPWNPASALRSLAYLERGQAGTEEVDTLLASPKAAEVLDAMRAWHRRESRRAVRTLLSIVPLLAVGFAGVFYRPLWFLAMIVMIIVAWTSRGSTARLVDVYYVWLDALDRLRERAGTDLDRPLGNRGRRDHGATP